MSERMIELRRAQMGLPPSGSSPSAPSIHSSSQNSSRPGSQSQQSSVAQQTPQQAAAAAVLSEDAQIQRFIHRLQRRDDSHPIAVANDSSNSNTNSSSNSSLLTGPTVPTALARRMLHRQGVGYLDDTVAAAISASADRFLATVLQQAVACRDQRLKGVVMTREAARHRKRHMQHYEADAHDRKRRKEEKEQSREQHHLKAIAAADALKKGSGAKDSDEKKSKKKKKKVEEPAAANGVKPSALKIDDEDDEASYDSIDEEEEYYQEKLGGVRGRLKGDDDEDEDTLLLRDLVRPLEAWDFHITGKEALEVREPESDEDEGDEELEENAERSVQQLEENGNDDALYLAGMEGDKFDGKQGDDADYDGKRKAASSPAPNAS